MPETFLIVDDHEALRTALRKWLMVIYPQSHVMEASTGEEAIDLIENEIPHLVIMDFKLPGMNGVEVTRRIRAKSPSVPIVMLTIREGDTYRAYAEAAGANVFIPKRVMFSKLRPALASLLSDTGN